ncbi:hypothetical protein I302_103394 [Kwoniella bestiolae CBS 10118]|uniref:Bromo domain-containing protein n=1 Tax=Kwoniella bestiolae CBS 10118 TaxID=1296100 RepID=A0A1B9G892_9TREE|nr:hypothetical protein I302_02094 [Kwoniella bestiolae CBS 10118]OCF27254.1 hypothetical protein I302_02094 [Kwoniella bestiolae CBS 10118]
MSRSLPNNQSVSSVPYYTSHPEYQPLQPGQPPQSGYVNHDYALNNNNATYGYQQGTHHLQPSGGDPNQPHPRNPQFIVNYDYTSSQPAYPAAYAQPGQVAYPYHHHQQQPLQQQQQQQYYSPSPQPQFHQRPSQLTPQYQPHPHPSISPAPSHSPAQPLSYLSPQPTYSQPYVTPPISGVDSSLVWSQPAQQPQPSNPSIQPSTIPPSNPPPAPVNSSPRKIILKVGSKVAPQTDMVGRSHHVSQVEQDDSMYSGRPKRGASQRAQAQMVNYREDEEDFEEDAEGEEEEEEPPVEPEEIPVPVTLSIKPTRSGRASKAPDRYGGGDDDFEDKLMPSSPPEVINPRRTSGRPKKIVVDPDDEEDEEDYKPAPRLAFPPRATRASLGSNTGIDPPTAGPSYTNGNSKPKPAKRNTRQSSRARHSSADAEEFEPTDDGSVSDEHASSDPLGNYEDEEDEEDDSISRSSHDSPRKRKTRSNRRTTRSMPTRRSTRSANKRADPDSDDEYGAGGRRNLRTRTSKPNYHIPTLDEISKEISMAEAMAAAARPNGRPGGVGGLSTGVRFGASGASKGLPWSVKGKDLAQAMGDPDTSDSDDFASPLKSAGAGAGPSMSSAGPVQRTNAVGPSDVPNYGRINPKSNMADADPLGVDMNVTFDNVGGLDDHINQLKEMVALPLLYPELFQQFGITPPRGVLFHGPPGTGKTLLARALAASCSTGNTKIAFFMRKGADVLSKWVGEAERQLRMLFEEARACQPSIIFFDEIDGIAPVRSSKQDQIHASLVSTLLALMDGMDGRGQVIVIGATNRPDAVDPALRRPGRFDREFYFPLPNITARKKIIQINTRKWEPQLSDEFLEKLAQLTKGYGGADLRALCTETALNAIQRRYPQIYKTADRLQLETKSINVSAKDFMMSIKKIVPSSARSTSSAAVQLPSHLVPLLSAPLERIRKAIDHVLPPRKHATALEEAEYEEEEGDSFEKHMMLQSLDKLRTFRPRILVHGEAGMGQTYLGPAILHHLEGFHVQSFDLGTLLGDSTRSIEASVVQLIIEAKRHQPSIIFVPSLSAWETTISDTTRATIRTLLDGISPSDPILLLGVSDANVDELPVDVRGLFGFGPENRIALNMPTKSERTAYFADLMAALRRPPTEFPDGMPRKKRVFEELPLAAPLPPRQPTAAELLREDEKDQAARDMIFQSFVHLVRDFMKRHRKVVASVKDDAMAYSNYLIEQAAVAAAPVVPAVVVPEAVEPEIAAIIPTIDGDVAMAIDPTVPPSELVNGIATTTETEVIPADPAAPIPAPVLAPAVAPAEPVWQAHPIDIDTLQFKLLKHKYYTPSDFLADISKIEENAQMLNDPERLSRIQEMASSARYHVQGFDQKWLPEFERYKERMVAKKAERKKKKESEKELEKEVIVVDGEWEGEATTIVNGATGEGEELSLKRVREDGEDEDGSQGREKRVREDEMEVDRVSHPLVNEDITTAITNGPSSLPVPVPTEIPSVPPPSSSTVVHPPFVLSDESMKNLKLDLDLITSVFNIDQLEQLRAGLFDIIWRGRGEWDRTGMVEKMRERIVGWGREVERWREGGRV